MFIAQIEYTDYNHYMLFNFPSNAKLSILALGAESAGNFSVYQKGKICFSENFGDLLVEKNWGNYQKAVLKYLKDNKIKPDVIVTDLHPLFLTTHWGAELAQKYKARHISVQHHLAHIFSAIGDKIIQNPSYKLRVASYGIACDGTGYGLDGKIWGGEIFKIAKLETENSKLKIERIGHLENQILIGGDLAVQEPARMLISILDNFLDKKEIYKLVKKYYSQNEFELLYNQLKQNFNCQETSSAGRVLDAISLLLGFCGNERKYKHEPLDLLEKNSTEPYVDLKPKILRRPLGSVAADPKGLPGLILDTAYLFNYVINYVHKKDKKRLAATAQLYLAQGLYEIISMLHAPCSMLHVFFAGGMANNKIISSYLESKDIYTAKKIPRGDAGLSFGQVVYYLLS